MSLCRVTVVIKKSIQFQALSSCPFSKGNILSQRLCMKYKKQTTITAFQRIFHFGRVWWSWKTNTYKEQATITAFQTIFHFGRVLWSWKANTYKEQATITALRENISLGRVWWSWKANTRVSNCHSTPVTCIYLCSHNGSAVKQSSM